MNVHNEKTLWANKQKLNFRNEDQLFHTIKITSLPVYELGDLLLGLKHVVFGLNSIFICEQITLLAIPF